MITKFDEMLTNSITDLDNRFKFSSKEWDLVKRNRAIEARNRFMQEHGVNLGIPYKEMPFETAEKE